MNIADTLVRELNRDILSLVTSCGPDDVEIPPELLDSASGWTLDALLSPEVDVVEGEPPPSGDFLGCYVPMRSPGLIVLYREPLRRFFWAVLAEVLRGLPAPVLRKEDLQGLIYAIVHKTYEHERLHHSADVLGHLLGRTSRDRLREEALAVAYARLNLEEFAQNQRGLLGAMSGGLRARALDVMFAYRSPGYRDWPRYAATLAFHQGFMEHLALPAAPFLVAAGVAVPTMLDKLLPVEGGFREVII